MQAVESGRQRLLFQQASQAAAELRSLPIDSNGSTEAIVKLFDVARLVKRLQDSSSQFEQPDQRQIWEQRGKWLREELVALTAERLMSSDPDQYWSNVISLIYVAIAEQDKLSEQLGNGLSGVGGAEEGGWMANLQANAQVIERLIELNNELMEMLNQKTAFSERLTQLKSQASGASCSSSATFPSTAAAANTHYGSHVTDHHVTDHHATDHHVRHQLNLSIHVDGGGVSDTSLEPYSYLQTGPETVPGMGSVPGMEARAGASPKPVAPVSLVDAFEAFMKEDSLPMSMGARVLDVPAHQRKAHHGARGGVANWVGLAARYITGGDRVQHSQSKLENNVHQQAIPV